MKKWVGLFCFLLGTLARGEDPIRGEEQKILRYPFGSVTYTPQPKKATGDPVHTGKLHARTQGNFKISFELVRDNNEFVARRVNVRVVNREEYLSPATAELRDHEAMHRRINETAAARIEKELSTFRVKETRSAQAEKLFKAEFQKRIDAVKSLHADWDNNQVFVQPASSSDHK